MAAAPLAGVDPALPVLARDWLDAVRTGCLAAATCFGGALAACLGGALVAPFGGAFAAGSVSPTSAGTSSCVRFSGCIIECNAHTPTRTHLHTLGHEHAAPLTSLCLPPHATLRPMIQFHGMDTALQVAIQPNNVSSSRHLLLSAIVTRGLAARYGLCRQPPSQRMQENTI